MSGNLWVYVGAQAFSGLFTSTFTLTFAYISDCLEPRRRAPAFGLALATFGISFCVGPLSGALPGIFDLFMYHPFTRLYFLVRRGAGSVAG
jgi:hypothetical protein